MTFDSRSLTRIALFAALIAFLGLIPKLDLPIAGGVPVTAQTLGVMLAGVVLGARRGAAAVALVILMVAMGLPLLAGGRGGLGVFAGPTVGFLIGWLPGAFVAGLVFDRLRRLPTWLAGALAATVGGILVVYACGALGLSLVTGMPLARAALASVAFVPGDLLKAALTGFLAAQLPPTLLARGGAA